MPPRGLTGCVAAVRRSQFVRDAGGQQQLHGDERARRRHSSVVGHPRRGEGHNAGNDGKRGPRLARALAREPARGEGWRDGAEREEAERWKREEKKMKVRVVVVVVVSGNVSFRFECGSFLSRLFCLKIES